MSQPSTQVGGHAVAGSSDARRRQLLAVVASLVIAAGAVVAYLVLSGRGGSQPANTPLGKPRPHAPSSSAPASASALAIPAVYSAQIGRNPFKPLVVAPVATAGASSTASTTPTQTPTPIPIVVVFPTPSPTPTLTPKPTPTVTVTATPSPTGLPTAGSAITLTLVSVDPATATANVTVTQGATTTPYNGVKPGQVFGTYFKLVSVLSSDPSTPPVAYGADFEYGDQFIELSQGDSAQLS